MFANFADLYHSKAIFTLTCDYNMTNVPVQSSKRILKYLNVSRNIFKIAELSRSYASVHYGPKDILKVLIDLPDISYDMLSLSTDCIVYNVSLIPFIFHALYRINFCPNASNVFVEIKNNSLCFRSLWLLLLLTVSIWIRPPV